MEMVIERCVFCGRVIPKGQRRCRCEEEKTKAKCPRFRDRNDYQGVSRIGCGRDDMQLRFASENERDEHYAQYCCDRCNECRWFGLNPSGASRHLPFQGRQGQLGEKRQR